LFLVATQEQEQRMLLTTPTYIRNATTNTVTTSGSRFSSCHLTTIRLRAPPMVQQ
jgi:hypothetical protein